MSSSNLILFGRVTGPIAVSVLAYVFWRYITNRNGSEGRQFIVLAIIYAVSRLGLWLLFAIYMQDFVTTSDPRLYYTPILEHFLAGEVPIRDFFYPYAPLLMPSMLPFYLLLGHDLAGISLFAIVAEALALGFFLKSSSILERRGEISRSWVNDAMAVYLLNPATLYWTVFHGYHSIVQTAYSMGALYLLLRGYYTIGYAVGFYGLSGSKVLALLDWPALLATYRPHWVKLFLGAIPLIVTYVVFQIITGDIFSPIRYHIGYTSEGNGWFLLTLFGNLHGFYSTFPGNLLPLLFFGVAFLLGLVHWLRYLRLGLTSFSFQAAMGMTTFAMSLFFLFSLYTGNYYIPMLMLPASLIVTCPVLQSRITVFSLLVISGFCIAGDAIWSSMGQPDVLIDVFSSGSFSERLQTSLWIFSILVRMACFARLAQLGLRVATMNPFLSHTKLGVASSPKRDDDTLRLFTAM